MANKKEYPTPFIKEDFPRLELEGIRAAMQNEKDLSKIKDALKTYKERLENAVELDSRKKTEYEEIVRYLKIKIDRRDPQNIIKTDRRYLEKRYRTNFNV